MERNATHRNILTVENPRGDYAVLPSSLSRRTKTLNDSIQNKFMYTSFCLETQRRKFCSYHNVESAKHQTALLNFRRSLKQRPWRENSFSEETPDAFSADVSHLSPVELSRFQLMRQIVAALPGEKVTIEDICSAMRNVGRTFTIDKDNQAVPIQRHSRRPSSFLHNTPEANADWNKSGSHLDNENQPKFSSNVNIVGKTAAVKETKIPEENVTAIDTILISTVPPRDKIDNSVNAFIETDIASSADLLSLDCHSECFKLEAAASEKPNPVFITEVNYKLLKSESKRNCKLPKVRKHHPVWQIRPKSPPGTSFKKGTVIRGPQTDKRTAPVVRRTDPYGITYEGGSVEREKASSKNKPIRDAGVDNIKIVEDHNDKTLSKQSNGTSKGHRSLDKSETPRLQDGKFTKSRFLSRISEVSACKEYKHFKPKPVGPKPPLTKTISWKEPLATTALIVGWDNETNIQHTRRFPKVLESNQLMSIKRPMQLNGTADDTNMTTSKGQRSKSCDAVQSKSVGSLPSLNVSESESGILKRPKEISPLSFLIMHEETESVCKRHRRWLVKTPDYVP